MLTCQQCWELDFKRVVDKRGGENNSAIRTWTVAQIRASRTLEEFGDHRCGETQKRRGSDEGEKEGNEK